VNGKNLRYAIQAETLNTVLPTELQESRYTALDRDPSVDEISQAGLKAISLSVSAFSVHWDEMPHCPNRVCLSWAQIWAQTQFRENFEAGN